MKTHHNKEVSSRGTPYRKESCENKGQQKKRTRNKEIGRQGERMGHKKTKTSRTLARNNIQYLLSDDDDDECDEDETCTHICRRVQILQYYSIFVVILLLLHLSPMRCSVNFQKRNEPNSKRTENLLLFHFQREKDDPVVR